MTSQHYNLRLAMACYFPINSCIIVPPHYHDHIVNAYNRNAMAWDVDQAAALTLFSAYYDGVLQQSDLTFPGQKALNWAEDNIDDLVITA